MNFMLIFFYLQKHCVCQLCDIDTYILLYIYNTYIYVWDHMCFIWFHLMLFISYFMRQFYFSLLLCVWVLRRYCYVAYFQAPCISFTKELKAANDEEKFDISYLMSYMNILREICKTFHSAFDSISIVSYDSGFDKLCY